MLSIASVVGTLGWGLAWLLTQCVAAWNERDEFSNWIGTILVAGMTEGFWVGVPVKDESINCDPASLIVGRLCNDERETRLIRRQIKKFSKKACCDCNKVLSKACQWTAKDKNLQLMFVVDIIVKTSLMEAAATRRKWDEAGRIAKEIINSLPMCIQGYGYGSSWMDCVDPSCNFRFFVAVFTCSRSMINNINGITGNTVIDKGILLKHSDADMYYGAEAIARFINDPSVNNAYQQLFYMISETPFPELIISKHILLKHQIQSGACGWAFLPISKPESIQFDRRPRICRRIIDKKYFSYVAILQVIIGFVLSVLQHEIFTFIIFSAGSFITILWSVNGNMNAYIYQGPIAPIYTSFLVVFGSLIVLLLFVIGKSELNTIIILQAALPILGIIFWWVGYFIKHDKKYNNVVLGMGIIIFILKIVFITFNVVVKVMEIMD